jgi:hypothetical protein
MSITTKSVSALGSLVLLGLHAPAWGQTCPQTSTSVTHGATQLEAYATAGAGGVVFDPLAEDLVLQKQAGSISDEIGVGRVDLGGNPTTAQPSVGCAADFDGDGWDDFVGTTFDGVDVGYWRNDTEDNYDAMTADWSNPSYTLTPKFTFTGWFENNNEFNSGVGGSATACADFNGDGNMDFLLIGEEGSNGNTPYRADLFRGNGDGTFAVAYPIASDLTIFNGLRRDAMAYPVDYNGDGQLDFLFPSKKAGFNVGQVRVFLNDGGTSPTFTTSTLLLDNVAVGAYGANAVTYVDYNRDGERDIAVGGVGYNGVKLYYGIGAGGFDAALSITDPSWPTGTMTGVQILVGGDFDLDGYNDLMVGTNQSGGHIFVWRDTGAPSYVVHDADFDLVHTGFADTDVGFALDYDNDPVGTMDFIIGDNNNGVFAFANRLYPRYVSCAEIISDPLDLGPLATASMVITAARLDPTELIPTGATLTWSMSNEEPANWQAANPCVDDPTQVCVAFAKPTGRSVRWRGELCTDLTHQLTPQISEVKVKFDYTIAAQHYRAGVVVSQGVAYVGGFEQPGDNGHFYALNANVDLTYWDAAQKLDGMPDGDRRIFTTAPDGITVVEFDSSGAATAELQATLGVTTAAEADDLVSWQRSARFGIDSDSRLGSVLTSTPAVLGPPTRPYYYNQLLPAEKARYDTFYNAYRNRPTLILFGSKDGALHAIQNDLTTITPADTSGSSDNGKEAWAFIPHRVAAGFLTDKVNSTVTSYPDGSPTLADVKIGTSYRTIAIVGSGNGGKGFAALDVTDTFGAVVTGPTPLWDYVPGGGNAGQATSKPSVIRVRIAGAERFLAVLATGVAYDNTTPPYAKGLDVEAVDVATGARVWRFRAVCPVSTDVIAFETDDQAEPGSPGVDGYVDRVVFADLCGNVYKLNPNQELTGPDPDDGWIVGMGPITTAAVDPASQPIRALFSVASTSLGEERPIAGTIGARADETGRRVLFFGTGGIESYDVSKVNAFYSIYVDNGEIRDQINGDCDGPGGACEKYYGGVVVTPEQVLVTRAVDPPIATSSCDNGSADILALDVQDLEQEFAVSQGSSVVSSLFGDGGALYATTLSGEIIRVGTPSQPNATTDPPTAPPTTTATQPIKRRTWREILY